ncbi:MAG: glycosyltransferase [Parcubacteria group bacterium]|nr:glycosyltransferase [Parcubacteria group bacterium]
MITIVLPVYNEEAILDQNTRRLLAFIDAYPIGAHRIVIVVNGSTDRSAEIAKKLAQEFSNRVFAEVINAKGKGGAIRHGFNRYPADIYCFMDADLATDLEALPRLLSPIQNSEADVVIGSRYHPKSRVKRSLIRKFFSLGYRILLRLTLKTRITDAPCGFKAFSRRVVTNLLPKVQHDDFSLDSELALRAEHYGLIIQEIPIDWRESSKRKSRVRLIKTSVSYLRTLMTFSDSIRDGSRETLIVDNRQAQATTILLTKAIHKEEREITSHSQ